MQLPSQLPLPGPVFVHQPPSFPNSNMSEPTDPRIGNGQLPPGYGQSMYPNNSFPMQQQQHFLHPKQLQHQNQHQLRPRMEAMPHRMTGPRQQMPQVNPNVFLSISFLVTKCASHYQLGIRILSQSKQGQKTNKTKKGAQKRYHFMIIVVGSM